MKLNILKYICVALPLAGLTACMDFDTPSDEFSQDQVTLDPIIYQGNADKLDFTKEISEEGFAEAEKTLANHFKNFKSAQYIAGGGKEGKEPESHAYQYDYSLNTDNYAGYLTMYAGTMSGDILYTYQYLPKYCDGPYFKLTGMSDMVNMLHTTEIDEMVEIKAIGLLLYDLMAQEMTDIYGAVPYADFKNNKKENPFTFNKGVDIYKAIIKNIDDINACLANFPNRPDWYQAKIKQILSSYDVVTITKDPETWRRMANSLKLRMAMHLVKIMPTEAKQWAEEAVAAGVIETFNDQIGYNMASNGLTGAHPLKKIMDWDSRINASFETMLFSLDHPYTKYFFTKNSDPIANTATGDVMPANTRVIGLRAGLKMEPGQQFYNNPRYAYSKIETEIVMWMPIYLFKLSEIQFLRAEGCLRNWNMGGSLEQFYEDGIRNATAEDVFTGIDPFYIDYVEDYLQVEEPTDYAYIDPADESNNHESVTKIGVKLLGSDSPETTLEKIITQKYIALFPNSYEAWNDIRRTGYPKIFPVLNPNISNMGLSDGDLIRRIPFPGRETSVGLDDINATGLEALGGPDNMATRVFWDVEGPNL